MKTVVAGCAGRVRPCGRRDEFSASGRSRRLAHRVSGPGRIRFDNSLQAAQDKQADLVGVSYRLTPETGERLLGEFAEAADALHARGVRFAFGGTPPVADRARQ